jgi:CDP-glucose 4,6-dehydratase
MEDMALSCMPAPEFWQGKRVLLTGHTGFKGSWLTIWLHRLGASVTGLSLAPAMLPNLFTEADVDKLCDSRIGDIRDRALVARIVRDVRPEIVLHLAAQPLVRASYRAPLDTFDTNVMGTAHVLDAMREVDSVRVAVMITTDKVYRDDGDRRAYAEHDPLGGRDPYSASKAACEIVIASYRDSFLAAHGLAVASARAGNVIGGGDWSEDRLLPDAARAWQAGKPLIVRMPQAIRPWQHVLEPLGGYLCLAQRLWQDPTLADAYNFGPHRGDAVPVRHVVELARRAYGEGAVVQYGDGSVGPYEAGWLALDVDKARNRLGVQPVWRLDDAIARTMTWYRDHGHGAGARQLCFADISEFEARSIDGSAAVEVAAAVF